MRIPHVNKYTIAKATVLTKNTGKNILRHVENCALAHDVNADKVMSTIMLATTFTPRFDVKVAKYVKAPEAINVVSHMPKKAQITKSSKNAKIKIISTSKTADNVRLMAKGEKINASKLNRNFNDLLLDNENKKNPLNNKGLVFVREARKHGVNPTLLMAIAMHESARGTSKATKIQRNIGGIMSLKGNLKHYSTVDLCIDQMAETLAIHHRESKINTVKELATAGKYCSKEEAKEWIKGVMYYINELEG